MVAGRNFLNFFSGAPSSPKGTAALHRSLKGRRYSKEILQPLGTLFCFIILVSIWNIEVFQDYGLLCVFLQSRNRISSAQMSPRVKVKLFVRKRQSITTTRPLDNYNSDTNLPQNSNTKLLSSDLKALHPIRELYKDRKAPEKPFDNNLILATCEGEENFIFHPLSHHRWRAKHSDGKSK